MPRIVVFHALLLFYVMRENVAGFRGLCVINCDARFRATRVARACYACCSLSNFIRACFESGRDL